MLIPTYKETLEIVAKTVHAAYNAPLPYGCLRTIYVCDDGKDGSKRKWCALRLLHQSPLLTDPLEDTGQQLHCA